MEKVGNIGRGKGEARRRDGEAAAAAAVVVERKWYCTGESIGSQ